MSANAALIDVREELTAKQAALGEIFDGAKGDDGSYDFTKVAADHGLEGDQKARIERVQALMAEVNDLGARADEYAKMEEAEAQVKRLADHRSTAQIIPHAVGGEPQGKSLGELFVGSDSYKKSRGKQHEIEIDLAKDAGGGHFGTGLKTLMTTSAGWAPETIRTGKLVDYATRPIQVIDLIPGETTNQSAVVYMEETTFTNAAAETAEGGAFNEVALALTERTSTVRKITAWLPVTDEQLEDEAQVQSYINNRLPFMVRQYLDSQILVGSGAGSPTQLEGLTVVSGVQTQAKGSDPTLDAIRKAKTLVRVTGRANPNALFIHPNDLEALALLRTADGLYILGNPNDDSGLERIWGLRTVETTAMTENTGFVCDTMMTGLAIKRNITLKVSDSHDTYFTNGKQAIRCDIRVALQKYRPTSGCKVTGI